MLNIFEKAKKRHPFDLHAYCLMTNHVHFLLETKDVHVSKIMHYLLSTYAHYFNKRYELNGHVFEKRFSAVLIKDHQHFVDTSRYIHLNPYKAKICDSPIKYPWSSYKEFLRKDIKDKNPLIDTRRTLSYFGEDPITFYKQYCEFASLSKADHSR
ncbi:transposase [Falsibacillus albus]|uniref:transposase n=1 Tax=Falsibacillus albus TaxID=2478915 RepID=UPI002D7A0CF8|nr:transposase [Falsibacillus albus]